MVFVSIQAEEKRQAIIDKQNGKLLQRIVDIMTSKKKTFPVANNNESRKGNKDYPRNDEQFSVECRK